MGGGALFSGRLRDSVHCFAGGDEARAAAGEFVEGGVPLFAVYCLNGICYERNAAMSIEQTFRGEAHAKFGDHAEDEKFTVLREMLQ